MWRFVVLLSSCSMLWSCGQSDPPAQPITELEPATSPIEVPQALTTTPLLIPDFNQAAEQIETWVSQHHRHLQTSCQDLFSAVQRFLAEVSDANQQQAQQSWHSCYQAWNQGLLLQQRGLTLNDSDSLQRQRRRINVRPFQPGYIDALPDYPYSGLIHETGLTLSLSVLTDQHQMLDLESAALGFPALETLLWQTPLNPHWLGDTDPETPATRRKDYLLIANDDLSAQLQLSQARWQGAPLSSLPESVQALWFWQSAHRLVDSDLYRFAFAPSATDEPQWHHPSWVAGSGRDHLVARLDSLLELMATSEPETPNPLRQWIDRSRLGVTADELEEHLHHAAMALKALPDNYPADSTNDAEVALAQEALNALIERLEQINAGLGQHL